MLQNKKIYGHPKGKDTGIIKMTSVFNKLDEREKQAIEIRTDSLRKSTRKPNPYPK